MKNSTKPKLNVKLLRRIKRHILEEPKRFVMRLQFRRSFPGNVIFGDDYKNHVVPECGTVACIAGWALLLDKRRIAEGDPWHNISQKASRVLGLREWVGDPWKHPLFQVEGWPKVFAGRFRKAGLLRTRAKIAAARIDHLIKTGR